MLDIPNKTEKSFADGKILKGITEGVGVVTFNNPEKRNAMSLDMWEGFGHALTELRDDSEVRVVILVGAGDKAFVSGADISQFEKTRHNAEASEEYSKRSAAQRALLANYGLKHLVSLVGPSWARLIMYTGMRIESAEALRIGLVDRVVPDAELWNATMEIARAISGNAPLAIQAAKITIAQVLKDEGQRDMEAIKQIGIACMDSEDFREGRRAFMEKRKPQFKGR